MKIVFASRSGEGVTKGIHKKEQNLTRSGKFLSVYVLSTFGPSMMLVVAPKNNYDLEHSKEAMYKSMYLIFVRRSHGRDFL